MPAKSKSQRRLMGMVHAYQKGELKTKDMDPDLLKKIKKMAKQMKPSSVKDFAETKHEGLPQKVEKIITKFDTFVNEAKKKRDIGKELRKELNRKEREERIKSGADLRTKVVPDKKKEYNRQKEKKVNLDED